MILPLIVVTFTAMELSMMAFVEFLQPISTDDSLALISFIFAVFTMFYLVIYLIYAIYYLGFKHKAIKDSYYYMFEY